MWPFMDNAIARILLCYPSFKIVMIGNQISSMLEFGWENEPRVVKKCGKWSIRESMAFAQLSDIVVGPETGTLNSVAFLDMPKIIFMSHSSPENLVTHWKNTIALEPEGTPCWPCHKMIYGWRDCLRDSFEMDFGSNKMIIDGAHCQTHITVDKFWDSFRMLIG
jgi:ADP-heptose:LPS heptosyltransferase